MREFNILYWNTNYKYGTGSNKIQDASEIVCDVLDDAIIKIKKPIHAIILSEGYPQIDDNMKCIINSLYPELLLNENCAILNHYNGSDKNKNTDIPNFTLFPYNESVIKICGIPFINMKNLIRKNGKWENWSSNPIIIMLNNEIQEKYKFFNLQYEKFNMLILKNEEENVYIVGLRMYNEQNLIKYIDLRNKLIDLIRRESFEKSKIICIGDFNPNSYKNNEIQDNLIVNGKGKLYDCSSSTAPRDGYEIFTDKLLLYNCEKNEFSCMVDIKKTYEKVKPDILYKKPNNATICSAPYPDHNLLFASINLGMIK